MSTDVDNDAPGLERLYRFDDSSTEVRDYTGSSAVTPLVAGITLPTSTAPVAPPPLGPLPALTGDVTAYVYDTSDLGDTTSSNAALTFRAGALIKRWLFGPMTDEPLAYESYTSDTSAGAGSVIELMANRLGSIILAVSVSTGTVAAEYDYDSYGIRTTVGTEDQPYGYTGREHDAESGLIYLRARYYDPTVGVFLQVDPIEFESGSLNLTGYVSNNPFAFTDPTGMSMASQVRGLGMTSSAIGLTALGHVSAGLGSLVGTMIKSLTVAAGMPDYTTAISQQKGIHPPYVPEAVKDFLQNIINRSKVSCRKEVDPVKLLNSMRVITVEIFARSVLHAISQGGDAGHRQQTKDRLAHLRQNCLPKVMAAAFVLSSAKGGKP